MAFEEYVETHKLILQSYGFDCDKGQFSIDVPPIDINSISTEFMYHIAYPAFGKVNNIELFVCGFIDAGYQFIYNGYNENESWILDRNKKHGRCYMNVEKVTSYIFMYEVSSFQEKILLENKEYTYDLLTKCKCIKSYDETECYKTRILKDKYGCLWLYVYDGNDHIYHIMESFTKIDNMESVDEQGKMRDEKNVYPSFYVTKGHHCFRFVLYKTFKDIPTDKAFEINELRKLQRMNGIIPLLENKNNKDKTHRHKCKRFSFIRWLTNYIFNSSLPNKRWLGIY